MCMNVLLLCYIVSISGILAHISENLWARIREIKSVAEARASCVYSGVAQQTSVVSALLYTLLFWQTEELRGGFRERQTEGRRARGTLTGANAPSRSARRRASARACCSCNTECTGRSRSTPYTSSAFPWCRASYSCHRWCSNVGHLRGRKGSEHKGILNERSACLIQFIRSSSARIQRTLKTTAAQWVSEHAHGPLTSVCMSVFLKLSLH